MVAVADSFRVNDLLVQVYDCEAAMAEGAAKIVQEYLQGVIENKGKANMMLATGNSQIKFLNALINLGGIDWSRVTFFHLDEYLGISPEHPGSFRYYLRERVQRWINPREFHYIHGDTLEPITECDRYSELLQVYTIDLCCLGIGDNGHLAFNDPAVANFQDSHLVKLVKLDVTNRQQQVNTGYFPNIEIVPQYAFTVTLPVICAASKIICLAPGERKAEIIKRMLESQITENIPASILRQQSQATLFLDVNSAPQ